MKKILAILAVAVVTGLAAGGAQAQTATATATMQVDSIKKVTVSGNPGTLRISTATAGTGLTSVSDNSTTYAVTTNLSNQKIVVSLDQAMPTDVTLKLTAAAPAGATSAGAVTLSASNQNLVTAITQLNASSLTLTYELSALVTAGYHASFTRTLTFTITNAS